MLDSRFLASPCASCKEAGIQRRNASCRFLAELLPVSNAPLRGYILKIMKPIKVGLLVLLCQKMLPPLQGGGLGWGWVSFASDHVTHPHTGRHGRHADPADVGRQHQLLPAHPRGRQAGRAGGHNPHPADSTISIDAMLQKEPAEGETHADIIMLTHQTQEKNVDAAIVKIEALATVVGAVTRIRMEQLS